MRSRQRFFCLLSASLLVLSVTAQRAAQGQTDISSAYEKVKLGLALIVNEKEGSSGSGFCIYSNGSESYFITNHHVVGDANEVIVIRQYPAYVRMHGAVIARTPGSIKDIATLASGNDLAIVLVNVGNIPALPLSRENPEEGAVVAVAGYPAAQFTLASLPGFSTVPSVHVGTVSALQNNGRGIQYDAQTFHGNSGGPIFDPLGHILAVVDLGFGGMANSQGQVDITNVNIGISAAKVLSPFLRAQHVTFFQADNSSRTVSVVKAAPKNHAFIPRVRLDAATGKLTAAELDDRAYQLNQQQQYEKALALYIAAAKMGDAVAAYNAGVYFHNGYGTEQNESLALKYYTLAANKGHAGAQCSLGFRYEKGLGVDRDYALAVKYYRAAADQGSARCQYNMGVLSYAGTGVDQSYEDAMRYFKLAADQGYGNASSYLSRMYYAGQGVDKDWPTAAKYAEQGVAQGSAWSMGQLAWMYALHDGPLPHDCAKAYSLLREAEASGDDFAVQWAKDAEAGISHNCGF